MGFKVWLAKRILKRIEKAEQSLKNWTGLLNKQIKRMDAEEFNQFCEDTGYLHI